MLVKVFPRDDGTGFLDDEMRDGDPLEVHPDSFEGSLGTQEKKSYLIIKIPDPPNLSAVMQAMVRPEYVPGPNPEENLVRRQRIYRIDWRSRFTAEEIDIIEDANATLPDGALASGGTVSSGVVSGKFTINDFIRK